MFLIFFEFDHRLIFLAFSHIFFKLKLLLFKFSLTFLESVFKVVGSLFSIFFRFDHYLICLVF
jgi:hypothetical protein